mgnify:CR=1 FL=1
MQILQKISKKRVKFVDRTRTVSYNTENLDFKRCNCYSDIENVNQKIKRLYIIYSIAEENG